MPEMEPTAMGTGRAGAASSGVKGCRIRPASKGVPKEGLAGSNGCSRPGAVARRVRRCDDAVGLGAAHGERRCQERGRWKSKSGVWAWAW